MIVVEIVKPIRNPEVLLMVLEVVFVVRVDVSLIILSEIEYIHAKVVFLGHIIIGKDEVDIPSSLILIASFHSDHGLVLHE